MKVLIVLALMVATITAQYPSRHHKPVYPKPSYHQPHYPHHEEHKMPYRFSYAVKDEESYNDFGHEEVSDGKTVTGTYYVHLPDGRLQTVNYKADEEGYVADVQYKGEAKYPKEPAYHKPSYPKHSYPKPSYPEPKYPSHHEPTYPSYPKPHYPEPEHPSHHEPKYPSYPKPHYPEPEHPSHPKTRYPSPPVYHMKEHPSYPSHTPYPKY